MNYIILDLEWNQSRTGKEEVCKILPFEIIEIGAIKLDSNRRIIDEFSELIKPQIYHEMHYVTEKLIHLHMKQLKHAKFFPEVLRRFLNWCGTDYIFCTWGPTDLAELQKNIKYYGLTPLSDGPFRFLDVQKLFSFAYEDRKSRRTLEHAIDFLEIEKDVPFHRALSDAYYTAKILACLEEPVLSNYSFDVFHLPKDKDAEIHVLFSDYAKYISRGFADKEQIIADKKIMETRCYLCHKGLRRKIRWFTPNGKHYYCVSYCDRHGFMKSKIRIRKAQEDMVYVVRTDRFITEEEVAEIRGKQDRAREQRKEKKALRKQQQKGH